MKIYRKKATACKWFVCLLSPWRHSPLAVLLPVLGIAASGTCAAFAEFGILGVFEPEVAAQPLRGQGDRPSAESPRADSPSTAEGNSLPDGIYLYGESPQPEQIQKTYLVFEVRRGLTVGAIYMPSSSFDCFYGNADMQQLKLTIVNSYEQTSYNFSIPLKEFHAIASVSDNDSRILRLCKDSYQELIWGK